MFGLTFSRMRAPLNLCYNNALTVVCWYDAYVSSSMKTSLPFCLIIIRLFRV